MLYSVLSLVALLSAVMSDGKFGLSSADDWNEFCDNDNEIDSIDGSDTQVPIHYCTYSAPLGAGQYYGRIYDSSGNMVIQLFTKTYSSDKSYVKFYGYLYLSNFAQDYSGDETFTFKFEKSNGELIVSNSINVINLLGSSVRSIIARLDSPNGFDEYGEGSNGAYSDGMTLEPESYFEYLWGCSIFDEVKNGYMTQSHFEGIESGDQTSGVLRTINSQNSGYLTYYSCDAKQFLYFKDDSSVKITSYLYDSNNNQLDSKSIVINFNIGNVENEESTSTTTTTEAVIPNGVCQEKPNKTKDACKRQFTQSDCERFNKCEWV
jgi:hypothetical protein